ncbi:MAG: cysteine--tRNA ligase [bacterium]|nr:cysteine--tRNA ligase [bacterium]
MIYLYDSLTKKKEVFKPRKGKTVTMYNCGPTVYDYVHIGNLRSFLLADTLRRYLEWRGYKVKQVMNITDVGHMVADVDVGKDKLEMASEKEKKTPWEIAKFYTQAFFEDIDSLRVKRAWKYPKATEHVPEMIKLIGKLLKKKTAYVVNGSVYYDLKTFPRYGALSGNKVGDLVAGKRVEVKEEKRNPYDFALWIENPDHVMQWKAPWSIKAGYPGWHIECSAMSMKYLGQTMDIHTGGEDNKFPHHECEIAQSEGATGKQFVRYWLHVKHLLVNGKKMSKSLGNFYTLRDVLQKGFSPQAVRYALLSTHYCDTLNFTFDSLKAAQAALDRLNEFVNKVKSLRQAQAIFPERIRQSAEKSKGLKNLIQTARQDFTAAMDDDLNVSKALAVIFKFVRQMNQFFGKIPLSPPFPPKADPPREEKKGERGGFKEVLELLKDFDKVLGFGIGKSKTRRDIIPLEIKKLAQAREKARQVKDWARADKLRQEIEQKGYMVEDTASGPRIKKASG